MSLLRYVIRRTLQLIPVFLAATVIVFFLSHLSPGNPVDVLFGANLSPDVKDQLKEQYHLNEPIWIQYLYWLNGILHGDFGVLIGYGGVGQEQKVSDLILTRLPVTFELAILGIFMIIAVSIPGGLLAALYDNTIIDRSILVSTLLGIGTPNFWLAIFLIMIFSVWIGIVPSGGWVPLTEDPIGNIQTAILPSFALAARYMGLTTRVFRADLLDVKEKEYIETAKAMGIPSREIVRTDMLTNAIIPTLNIMGLSVIGMISGSIIVETIFELPGLGQFILVSILERQYAATQGITVLFVILFLFLNLLVDILSAKLDPRITTE